jgi:hypothetical protein
VPSSPPETTLEAARPRLQLFYQALSGQRCQLATDSDIANRRQLDTETTLRLPDGEQPGWYRIALAHRAMHEDVRTDGFRLDGSLGGLDSAPARRPGETDLRFALRSTLQPPLAFACFRILDEMRVDEALARQYPGLAPGLRELQRRELAHRPRDAGEGAGGTLFEALVRASLGEVDARHVPADLKAAGNELITIAAAMRRAGATVQDTVHAARRAHDLILGAVGPVEPNQLMVIPVRYRDALDLPTPELEWDGGDGAAVEAEDTEMRGPKVRKPGPPPPGARPVNLADVGIPEPVEMEPDSAEPTPDIDLEDRVQTDDINVFVYPEWDYRAGTYRERWCEVRESIAASGASSEVYGATLHERRKLVTEIRQQFERIAPETLRRIRGVREGDDLDMDAAIDALADLRAGIPPSDNVYVTRERAQRDVAVVFLVDLSYSTRQYVPRGERSYKPIFEIEREALILLMEPLARVGDVFGMYGFSGDGRHDVRFIVIKDIRESLNSTVISRLDSLQPIHTTRMGAAIRHATTKLRGLHAGTRLLMVISDGRPSDIDYGQEYGSGAEVEYAIRDTRAALDETRAQGIRPFLLTVDANGSDYLRQMADELDYEVLDHVEQLPERLAALYGHLTLGSMGSSRGRRRNRPDARPMTWLTVPAVG